jgi:glutathione synthase/RimK-type ligase-like ATP-grasp enzyme
MKQKIVLVVSYPEDGTAQHVVKRLQEKDMPVSFLDMSSYPDKSSLSFEYQSKQVKLMLLDDSKEISGDSIVGIWWRRPFGKIKPKHEESPISLYIANESAIMVDAFFRMLPNINWVSDPHATRLANSKPFQLQLAKELGFRIPRTLISNNPVDVTNFMKGDDFLIMKPVGTCCVYNTQNPADGYQTIYTRIIDKNQILASIEQVKYCPVIFQEAISDKLDVRVTVVEKAVFAVEIQNTKDFGAGASNLDWRNHKLNRVYRRHDLPESVIDFCVQITQKIGLKFAAIDLCYSPTKGYVFLEINPQGQWLPSELEVGHTITDSLIDLLTH